jgi:hypothetical protein
VVWYGQQSYLDHGVGSVQAVQGGTRWCGTGMILTLIMESVCASSAGGHAVVWYGHDSYLDHGVGSVQAAQRGTRWCGTGMILTLFMNSVCASSAGGRAVVWYGHDSYPDHGVGVCEQRRGARGGVVQLDGIAECRVEYDGHHAAVQRRRLLRQLPRLLKPPSLRLGARQVDQHIRDVGVLRVEVLPLLQRLHTHNGPQLFIREWQRRWSSCTQGALISFPCCNLPNF